MLYLIWFLIGLAAVIPLLMFAQCLSFKAMHKLMGRSLIIVALIYIGFAVVWGDGIWLGIESLGVLIYGLFYWLSVRLSILWLALGWLVHPVWDVIIHLLGPGVHVVPDWYAIACVSFDIAVAAYIVYRRNLEQHESVME